MTPLADTTLNVFDALSDFLLRMRAEILEQRVVVRSDGVTVVTFECVPQRRVDGNGAIRQVLIAMRKEYGVVGGSYRRDYATDVDVWTFEVLGETEFRT